MSEQMRVGFAGYRGMVGSVLMERMLQEGDFAAGIDPVFMSTNQDLIGSEVSIIKGETHIVADAEDLAVLRDLDAVVTCQGSEYTKQVHPRLRASDWDGYWIDAASHLRGSDDAVLVLDPVNRPQIDEALSRGVKDLVGPNCSTAILDLGAAGLFKAGLVEHINMTTMQAISGAGAHQLRRELEQIASTHQEIANLLNGKAAPLEIAACALKHLKSPRFAPAGEFGRPIMANALPWIGEDHGSGHASEEEKAFKETNKLLETKEPITIDCTCIRIDTLRSHLLVPAITLKEDLPLDEIEDMIKSAHEWVTVVPNTADASLDDLTPISASESLNITVGRLRKTSKPREFESVIIGDQLLWGAAEPLRRTLSIVKSRP